MDLNVLLIWVHLAGIVTWVGLWFTTILAVIPLRKHLTGNALAGFIAGYRGRYAAITWSAMAVFIVTGTVLMLNDENYPGLGQFFDSDWATLIFIKHIVVILMIAISLSLLYGILPRLLAATVASDQPSVERLLTRERLAVIGLAVLGLAVLFIIATVGDLHAE